MGVGVVEVHVVFRVIFLKSATSWVRHSLNRPSGSGSRVESRRFSGRWGPAEILVSPDDNHGYIYTCDNQVPNVPKKLKLFGGGQNGREDGIPRIGNSREDP
jgi:hypothetical protein